MKLPAPLRRWQVRPKAAIAIQRRLVNGVRVEPLAAGANLVGGVFFREACRGRPAHGSGQPSGSGLFASVGDL